MRDLWRMLSSRRPPPPGAQARRLSQLESVAVAVMTVVAAISRLFAVAASPWDWDEMLFMLGMRHYDVALHHPHPPGFPLFIALADVLRAVHLDDFHALQVIAFLGAIAIVPATVYLCRQVHLSFATSLIAATLLAFFPNVWLFGGTGLSDVPSMTLVIIAIGLLLHDDPRAYFAGAIVLGIAAGFRPQNLLIGFAPAILASVRRRPRDVVIAALIGAAIVGASYGIAAQHTGWSAYREAVAAHQQYITQVDSFRSPARPPLWKVFDFFFVRPYRALPINLAIAFFVTVSFIASCVKRRKPLLTIMAAFAPFCLFAWLMLDHFSSSRFSIGYAPLIAVLAADGIVLVARRAAFVVAAIVVAMMIVWTWPALTIVRTTISPPMQAMNWIRTHAGRHTPLYVHGSMAPYADVYLSGFDRRYVLAPPPALGWYLREDRSDAPGAINFSREHGHLWDLTRHRYFDVSLRPLTNPARYGAGWYAEEASGEEAWRWMQRRSETTLPPIDGPAHLQLVFMVPEAPANIIVSVDGVVVARAHAADNDIEVSADVAPSRGPRQLVIETGRTIGPTARDPRTLGLRLNAIVWTRAQT